MCVIKIGTMTELNGYLDYNGLIVSIQPPIAIQLHPQCLLGIQSILQFSAERVVTIIAFYIK